MIYLILLQIEIAVIIAILAYLLISTNRKQHHKHDPLLRHFKEYIIEGYTFKEVKDKLARIGFEKERIDKITQDFLKD